MFIQYFSQTKTAVIDGQFHKGEKIKCSDGKKYTQIYHTKMSKSGFDWSKYDIEVIIGKNLIVRNNEDLAIFAWFIKRGFFTNFSHSVLSPKNVDTTLIVLKESDIKEGSSMGFLKSDTHLAQVKEACTTIGFETVIACNKASQASTSI